MPHGRAPCGGVVGVYPRRERACRTQAPFVEPVMAGHEVYVSNCAVTFYDDVANEGMIKNTGGTVRILGAFSGGGS